MYKRDMHPCSKQNVLTLQSCSCGLFYILSYNKPRYVNFWSGMVFHFWGGLHTKSNRQWSIDGLHVRLHASFHAFQLPPSRTFSSFGVKWSGDGLDIIPQYEMVDFPSHMPQNSSVKCSYIKRAFDFASHTCDIVLVSMHLSNSITNHIMKFVDFKSVQRPKKTKD